ncbi:GH25 family lysozyme [Bacillus wiedmannii]|uniref:GH25 family lysozyme n=1 Tax=Bacillus wiedmannii TaxID=1890302 RepID=UPI000BF42761|nr:GH25 family lysozyme [Bacillus wiedmannii]PGB64746.1 N-acetylmuramoyl-L-alanine amidase [Bacillus wiedmannii]
MKYLVDISKWNDKINWPVAALQIELAICRVQYGSNLVDHLYNEHVTKLESYGIPHAAYAYGCFVSVADAIVEAKDFLARVNPNAKFLVLDVEDDTVKSMKSKGNLNDLAKASQAFIDTCKAAGWKVGFYVAHHMYGDYNLQSVQADFIWLPRYGTNDGKPQKKPSYPCDIWQYTDNGHIDGIGKVDINLLQGDKGLEWFTGVEQTTAASQYDSSWFTKQDGVFTLDRTIHLRDKPRDGNIIATLNKGDNVTYDAYGYEKDGYVWIRQPRSNGYGYIATGETSNEKRVSSWGSFK